MYSKKSVLIALLLVSMAPASFAANQASALAVGSDNSWGWATRGSQQEANKVALDNCNQHSLKKDCKLDFTKAVVLAEGVGRIGYGVSSTSVADAKKIALEACNKKSCKITYVVTSPGFFAIAKADKDEGGNTILHLAYQYSDSDKADADAVQRCQQKSKRKCSVAVSSVVPGIYKLDAALEVTTAQPVPVCTESVEHGYRQEWYTHCSVYGDPSSCAPYARNVPVQNTRRQCGGVPQDLDQDEYNRQVREKFN